MTQLPSAQQPAIGGVKLVVTALVLAILAVVLNSLYINSIQRRANEDTFAVYLLNRSVAPGERIRSQDLKKVMLPKQRFWDSFRKGLDAMDETGVKSRVETDNPAPVQRAIGAGEILRYIHYDVPEARNIDIKIPEGMRLVSLPVNSRTLPGALREGMFVDIEAAFQVDGAIPQVLTILEYVNVVAVGTRTVYDDSDAARTRAPTSYHSITILVKPADATYLAMIERMIVGDFEIQLRNSGDSRLVKIKQDDVTLRSAINPQVISLIEKKTGEPMTPRK